jgi:hypothetical protein
MKNKSNLSRIVAKVKTPTSGEIMAAANRGDKNIDGAEVLKKPPVSEAQRRFMGAAAHGDVKGVSPEVGKEFIQKDPGGKLPERVEKAKVNPVVAKPTVTLPKPEQLHMPGHEKWNLFVNLAANDNEDRGGHGARAAAAGRKVDPGQGVENARIFALNVQRAHHHANNAASHIGPQNYKEVANAFKQAAIGMQTHPEAEEHWRQIDQAAVAKMAKPEMHEEARSSVLQSVHHNGLVKRYLHTLGIPEEHHAEILESAKQFGKNGVTKSMGIMGKLRKALPSAKEDKQDAGEKSPSLDRVTVAPEEGKTRPFIDSKTAIEALREQQKRFKHKIEQDRCDGGESDDTAIYSMNDANVEKPLEKAAPSYKTLRAVKLPDGQKVNVYGNNGYERISNGPHRGRYLHSVLAEHKLGRKLGKDEEIDHKNGDRRDNSHSNMRVTTTSEHASHTNSARAQQGGFTGEKRYMHSREYTEGKPETVEKAQGGGSIRSILKKCKSNKA